MTQFTRQRVDTAKLPGQVVNKWSEPVLAEGFVPFPKKLVRALSRIFPNSDGIEELCVLLAIVDFKRPNLTRDPSLAFLAFVAGLSADTFRAALDRLARKGLVRVEGNDEGLAVSLEGVLEAIQKEAPE